MNLAQSGFKPLASLTDECYGLSQIEAQKYAQLWSQLWLDESSKNSSCAHSSQPGQDSATTLRQWFYTAYGDHGLNQHTITYHFSTPYIDLKKHSELAVGKIAVAAAEHGLDAFVLRQEYHSLVAVYLRGDLQNPRTQDSLVTRLLLLGHPSIGKTFAVHFLLFLSLSLGIPVFAQFDPSYTLHFSGEGAFVGPSELDREDQELREAIHQASFLLDVGETPLSPSMLACVNAARVLVSAASPNPHSEKQLRQDITPETSTSVFYLGPMTDDELFYARQHSGLSLEAVKQKAFMYGPFLPDMLAADQVPSQAELDGMVERAMGGMLARISKLLHGQASTVWDQEDAQLARRVFLLGPTQHFDEAAGLLTRNGESQIKFLSPAMEQVASRICQSDRLKTLFKLKKLFDANAPATGWLVHWLLNQCLPCILAADPKTISTYNMSMSSDAPLDYQRPLTIETVSDGTDCLMEYSSSAGKGRLLVLETKRFPSVGCAILLDETVVVVQAVDKNTRPPTDKEMSELLSFVSSPDRCIKRVDLVTVGTHEGAVVERVALARRRLSAYPSEGAEAQGASLDKGLIKHMEVSGFVWNPTRHSLSNVAL